MKKSRFTEEQMVEILREADRDGAAAAAKRRGVSEQTIYTWRKRFGAFQPDEVRRLLERLKERVNASPGAIWSMGASTRTRLRRKRSSGEC